MYRLWAKIIKNEKIIESLDIYNNENISLNQKKKKCFEEICYKLDLSIPMWLDKHTKEFIDFKRAIFHPDDFIDDVDFDRLEIDLIDDGNSKNSNN